MTPWLSDAEISDLCAPLTQPAAQTRYLRDVLQLQVKRKPNGRPLVLRSHAEQMLGPPAPKGKAAPPQPAARREPNAAGLQLVFAQR